MDTIQTVSSSPPARESYYRRQMDFLPYDRIRQLPVAVIGVGAVGRQLALQLAASGHDNVTLIDHDEVEAVNCGPQGYSPSHIGRAKVAACRVDCHMINPACHYEFRPRRFSAEQDATGYDVVFCCVDSMAARKEISETTDARLFIDSRVGPDSVQILTNSVDQRLGEVDLSPYADTLFSDAEARPARCTAKISIYAANIAAGLMMNQYSQWLRDMPPMNTNFTLDLLSMHVVRAE